jgi:hypothetical protein
MDNCAKENKNWWFLGFCCLLIHWGWFRCVQLSFLPPGHSHNIVDQMFSTRQKHLQWVNFITIPDALQLVDHIYSCIAHKPSQLFLPCVFNWIGWFGPFMRDIKGHSKPHVFKFELLSNGDIAMWHKPWHSSQNAFQGDRRSPSHPVLLFKHGFPSGSPDIVPPTMIDPALLADIPSLHDWMSTSEITWWSTFAAMQQPPDDSTQLLSEDLWNTQSLSLAETSTSHHSLLADRPANVLEMTNQRSSSHHVPSKLSVVPAQLANKMLALVQPSESSQDKFWLCKIRHVVKSKPVTYAVRYYSEDPETKVWTIMSKIPGSYGTVSHDAVPVAGFSLTATEHLRKNTVEQVQNALLKQAMLL